ncbi:hypothetical protein BKA70DRAFT_1529524 [Coprinopsis sp. MPI-PUGE-AT-0042]|nr:hypothetical protein BKA70DRAFT_1529524 [Coprinopsis sp. MPI-PUGE-AT-0042]
MSPTNVLLSYLHNNLPLPDELIQPWQSHRNDLTHSISTKGCEIKELKRQLKLLEKERFSLKEKRVLVTSLRSAVRRLPAELIALIMYFTLELNKGPLGNISRSDFMALRSVSSLWRETAFATPYLWKSLAIDLSQDFSRDHTGTPTAPRAIERVNSWFANAGAGCYVSLSIYDSWAYMRDPWAYLSPLLNDQSRFQLFALELGPCILRSERDQHSLCTASAPKARLRSLILTFSPSRSFVSNEDDGQDSDTGPRQMPRLPFSEAFPHLECLSLKGDLSALSELIHPTIKSLTLDVAKSTALLFSKVAHRLPALEELIIISLDPGFITDGAPVQLPSLKRLTLIVKWSLVDILPIFTCPRLQWMHLIGQIPGCSDLTSPLADELVALVTRSRAPHFTLRVSGYNLDITLSRLLSPSWPIHRLDVTSADWLPGHATRGACIGLHLLPSSLLDIYIREDLSSQTNAFQSVFGFQTSFGAKSWNWGTGNVFQNEGFGSRLSTEIPQRGGGELTRTIDVYAPGMEEKAIDSQNSTAAQDDVSLRFHQATEEWIDDLLHHENSVLFDGYEALVQKYAPAPAKSIRGGHLTRKSSQDSITSED